MKCLREVVLLSLLGAVFGAGQTPVLFAQSEDLTVLGGWIQWSDAASLLQHRLNVSAFELLEKRAKLTEGLKTADDWRKRISEARAALDAVIGPFPERTPLNPRILGTVRKDGYTIEKIVFESMPGFYVTNCLFIPSHRSAKAPAILYLSGHTAEAFRNPRYQQLVLNFVSKGFIVLAMDPVGQGERLQYYDPGTRKSLAGGSTAEHSYFGKQCFLTGASAARYFTWDGIRAIDYLVSRPEVDPERIGVTGLSGGGTQTSYIAAMDNRVAAAAPGGDIEQIVKRGYAVLAPDLSGTGELGRATDSIAFLGVQTGRTIVGIRAEEIIRCVRFLKGHQDVAGDGVCALAFGELGIPLLHAAVLDDSITKVALIEPLVSFQSVVNSCFYSLDPGSLIGNVLTAYDLPDLAACLVPRGLLMVNPVDGQGKPATTELATESSGIVHRAYSVQEAAKKVLIRTGVSGSPITDVFIPWLD